MALRNITALLLYFLCTAFTCRAEPLDVYCDSWPRFCQAEGKGIYLDLVRAIYQPHGYVIVPHIVPYKRAIYMVANNEGGIALEAYQHELENVLIPKYPDSADDLTVMMLKQWQYQWRGESTLAGQQVLWPYGWGLEKYLSVKVNSHEVDSPETAIKLLRKNRYRYYLTVGSLHIADTPPADMHLVLLRWIPTYPLFPKSNKGEKLLQIWDTEMVKLVHRGELAQLYRRHGLYDIFQDFIQDMERNTAEFNSDTAK